MITVDKDETKRVFDRVVTFQASVPLDDIIALLDTAIGWINYWCDEIQICPEEEVVRVRPTDEHESQVTTFGALATTLLGVAQRDDMKVCEYARSYLTDLLSEYPEYAAGNIDAELADVVLQLALFGEVVYG